MILFLVYITNDLCNVVTARLSTAIFVHLFPFLAHVRYLVQTCSAARVQYVYITLTVAAARLPANTQHLSQLPRLGLAEM